MVERASLLRSVVAFLAVVQGLLSALRALDLVSIGIDIFGRGVILLPLLGSLIVIRGVVVAATSVLYAMFAWGAMYDKAWARLIGSIAALVNLSLVGAVLLAGDV